MSLTQGMVPDTRPPGYVSGPIPGPVGNSRVRFRVNSSQGTDWLAGWYAMGAHAMSTSPDADPFQTTWSGALPSGLVAQMTLSIGTVGDAWVSTYILQVQRSGLPNFTRWLRTLPAQPMGPAVVAMLPSVNAVGASTVYQVKEWVDMNAYLVTPTWLE